MRLDSFLDGSSTGDGGGERAPPGGSDNPPDSTSPALESKTLRNWDAQSLGAGIPDDIWENSGYQIPESWSKTFDSLLSEAVGGAQPGRQASSDSASTYSAGSSIAFAGSASSATTANKTAPGGVGEDASSVSQSQKEWEFLLSSAPSDPFNIFSTASQPENGGSCIPTARPQSSGETPTRQNDARILSPMKHEYVPGFKYSCVGAGQAGTTTHPDNCSISTNTSYRLLGVPKPHSNPGYISPTELAHAFLPDSKVSDFNARGVVVHRASSTQDETPPARLMPAKNLSVDVPLVFCVAPRGLGGWKPQDNSGSPATLGTTVGLSGTGTTVNTFTELPPLKPPYPRPSSHRLNATPQALRPPTTTAVHRTRRNTVSSVSSLREAVHSDDNEHDHDHDDEEDSDVYQPSSSPMGSRHNTPSDFDHRSVGLLGADDEVEAQSRRGKGKAKGSAALALAVVTQISKLQGSFEKGGEESLEGGIGTLDSLECFEHEAVGVRPGRKRKNNPIPLPVPVPHLIKKSRGRKVPYAEPRVSPERSVSAGEEVGEGVQDEEEGPKKAGRSTRGRRSASAAAPYSLSDGGKRAYKCDVAGCGKCFVRGEHLKRHVRSIHTYDKPHPCPYQGCIKSFSRRDNLGQHVRIHLQS